jgi:hypothetical protein
MVTKTRQQVWSYGEISVEDIVEGALALVERSGLAKLTMRNLADELGVSTAVAYYLGKSSCDKYFGINELSCSVTQGYRRYLRRFPYSRASSGWATRLTTS